MEMIIDFSFYGELSLISVVPLIYFFIMKK